MTVTCEHCGQPLPGDHEQAWAEERSLTTAEPTRYFTHLICPFVKCEKPMQSGLKCQIDRGHLGPCFDKFGLRDPVPAP